MPIDMEVLVAWRGMNGSEPKQDDPIVKGSVLAGPAREIYQTLIRTRPEKTFLKTQKPGKSGDIFQRFVLYWSHMDTYQTWIIELWKFLSHHDWYKPYRKIVNNENETYKWDCFFKCPGKNKGKEKVAYALPPLEAAMLLEWDGRGLEGREPCSIFLTAPSNVSMYVLGRVPKSFEV